MNRKTKIVMCITSFIAFLVFMAGLTILFEVNLDTENSLNRVAVALITSGLGWLSGVYFAHLLDD